jgi:hypothetical protein
MEPEAPSLCLHKPLSGQLFLTNLVSEMLGSFVFLEYQKPSNPTRHTPSPKPGLFFWRYAPEWRSGTYLKEQISKKAKTK